MEATLNALPAKPLHSTTILLLKEHGHSPWHALQHELFCPSGNTQAGPVAAISDSCHDATAREHTRDVVHRDTCAVRTVFHLQGANVGAHEEAVFCAWKLRMPASRSATTPFASKATACGNNFGSVA